VSEDVPPYGAWRPARVGRNEEDLAIERAVKAFQRKQDAIHAVMGQMTPHGNGVLSQESMDELEAANAELKAADAEADRILNEILSGKRR
jgi:hypothetical protein